MNYVFGIYTNIFDQSLRVYGVELHAFVQMNNHFHMILSAPSGNLSRYLTYFMTQSSKAIAKRCNRINQVYGARNHKTLIGSEEYYAHCLKYVYRNPLRAGVCEKVEDYRWSTVSRRGNRLQELITPPRTGHDSYIPKEKEKALLWLNEKFPAKVENAVRSALLKPVFRVPGTKHSAQPNV